MKRNSIIHFLALAIFAVVSVRAEIINLTYDSGGRLIAANYGSGKTSSFQYDSTGNLVRSANGVIVDSDNDGMLDSWEQNYFQTLGRDGAGDFDLDGMSDAAEFLAGTLPDNGDSLLKMHSDLINNTVSTSVEWDAVAGKTYRLQYKDSLSQAGWNDLPGDITANGATAAKTDNTTAGQPTRFYRVQVVQQ